MPAPVMSAQAPYRDSREESSPSLPRFRPRVAGLAFLVLCLLIALGATRSLDWWVQKALAGPSAPLLDVTGFLLTLLGEASITAAVAVILAVRGWHHRREQGLGPLLLFVGVGMEVLLKYVLPHPGPPVEFSHRLHVPEFLRLSGAVLLRVSTGPVLPDLSPPYAFPSGHMLRTTFLVTLVSERRPQWRVAGWVLVGAMAVTRVYCNEHWLSDVVGGTLLGWILAGVATAL